MATTLAATTPQQQQHHHPLATEENKEYKYITLSELALHNKPGDLWISIHGKIYDVTEWSHRHPGGVHPLISFAGQEATDAFLAFHPPAVYGHRRDFFTGYLLRDYSVSEVSQDYRRLVTQFSKSGLFEQKGHVTMVTLICIAMLFVLSVYGAVFCEGTLVHLLCGIGMGCLWSQSGWIGHDSGHYNVMSERRYNRFTQILTGNCLAGISIAWWKWNHNAHHLACNSIDFDPDVQHMPLFVVSTKFFGSIFSHFYERTLSFNMVARFLVSYQHLTFYPVMCFARINLFMQSFVLLLSKRRVPNRGQEILGVLVFWIWYPFLISFLPNWGERIMFVVASFAVTGIQHVQFCLNHFSSSVYVGPPKGDNWFEKQTAGTLNITCSPSVDWFHGGLQFQIEHHLFPRLPRCQLRKVSPFVKELCKKHKLPYHCVSFWKANALTIGTLRTAALQARDLANPVPKNLVWEAVNTHG